MLPCFGFSGNARPNGFGFCGRDGRLGCNSQQLCIQVLDLDASAYAGIELGQHQAEGVFVVVRTAHLVGVRQQFARLATVDQEIMGIAAFRISLPIDG